MRPERARRGVTLTELMIAMALLGLIAVSFAGFLRSMLRAGIQAQTQVQGTESVRQALARVELELSHADQVTIASATLVEFVADIDHSPVWDPGGDTDGDGIPNLRDPDTDCDAAAILTPATRWQAGYNLTDDDEDGDGKVDLKERLYFAGGALWQDLSVDEEPWGRRVRKLLADVSTCTFTYLGSKANQLGMNCDGNGDGIVSAAEIDACAPPGGPGDGDGRLDTAGEFSYVTTIRMSLGVDVNHDGKSDYSLETDVYPPLLPLKPLQQ
ncbi:MAG: prepilin-type N-terminal cleavage/methylation domain-containing protein [Elusimicrobia bacterium]|nr:prepilin-type N-terminal cleavage/methylation domain-containing protein [Elusimicrobiota bacterium]